MSIAVNTGNTNAVNWEQILSSIGDVKKADSVDGKESFTITIKGDEGATTITVNIPDDLEIPENVDKSTLQGLVDKLAKSGVGFTDKQIAQMKDSISAYYDEMVKASRESARVIAEVKNGERAPFDEPFEEIPMIGY